MRSIFAALALALVAPLLAQDVEALLRGDADRRIEMIRAERMHYTPLVVRMLLSRDPLLRQRAALALREMDPETISAAANEAEKLRPMVVAALAAAARDPEVSVRNEAVRSLLTVLHVRGWGIHGAFEPDRGELRPIIDLGLSVIPLLKEILEGYPECHGSRMAAVRVLAKLRGRQSLDLLLETIDREWEFIMFEAMEAAATYPDPRVVSTIVRNTKKRSGSYGTSRGIEVLQKIKDRAVPALLAVLATEKDADFRSIVSYGFADIIDVRALPALVKALTDLDNSVRQGAKTALSAYPAHLVQSALVTGAQSSSAALRRAAIQELGERRMVNARLTVVGALKDADPDAQIAAKIALAKFDAPVKWIVP